MVVDEADHMADNADVVFALQSEKIRFQGRLRAAQRDIVDAVVLEIAEGRGVALLAGEEVLIDAQNLRA